MINPVLTSRKNTVERCLEYIYTRSAKCYMLVHRIIRYISASTILGRFFNFFSLRVGFGTTHPDTIATLSQICDFIK